MNNSVSKSFDMFFLMFSAHFPNLVYNFSSQIILLWNNFYTKYIVLS